MLIACDAFKIGDGIRIIGRRIALCYITLHYIEKRRIQTAQIPVDRGIVTFNEKITVHATADDVAGWTADPRRLVVIVPEFDDYLRPVEARERFSSVPGATLVAVDGGKHLWVGETQTRRVLTEIVAVTHPDALPLPTEWDV